MKNNKKKGFTIVELVIVIAVIAILAAVLIPTFSNVISQANQSNALQVTRNAWTDRMVSYDVTNLDAYDFEVYCDEYVFYITDGTFNGTEKDSSVTYAKAAIIDNKFYSDVTLDAELRTAIEKLTKISTTTTYKVQCTVNGATIDLGYATATVENSNVTWSYSASTSATGTGTITISSGLTASASTSE